MREVYEFMGVVFSVLCMLMCDCPPCPFFLSCTVIFDLQTANLMTSEECSGLNDLSDVVRVQSKKPQEILDKSAEILKRHRFREESKFLAGNFDLDLICSLVLVQIMSQNMAMIEDRCNWLCFNVTSTAVYLQI